MTTIQLTTGKAVTIADLVRYTYLTREALPVTEGKAVELVIDLIADPVDADTFVRAYWEHRLDHMPGILPVIGPDGRQRVNEAGDKVYVRVGAAN